MDRLAIWDGTLPFLVSLCFVLLPLFRRRLRRRAENLSVRPLDLDAFQAVMEREDETFLREKLSGAELFRLKRRRIRVTWKYLRRIAHNAVTVRRFLASSRYDSNVNVAQTAKKAAGLAWRVHAKCLLAFAKLSLEYMFPAIRLRRHRS